MDWLLFHSVSAVLQPFNGGLPGWLCALVISRCVMLPRSETLLHDHFGGTDYWKVRTHYSDNYLYLQITPAAWKYSHTQRVMYFNASFSLSHPLSQTWLIVINQRRKFSMILNLLLLPGFCGHSCWRSYLLFPKARGINISERKDRGGSVWRG